jgi:hypothetical protein
MGLPAGRFDLAIVTDHRAGHFEGECQANDLDPGSDLRTRTGSGEHRGRQDVPAAAALKLLLAEEFEGKSGGLFAVIGRFKRVVRSRRLAEQQEGQRLWTCSETLIRSALDSTIRTFVTAT